MTERSPRPGALVATSDAIELAAEILTAFVANNSVPRAELAALFEGLHASLKRLAYGEVALPVIDPPTPAVSIRKSVTPDYLICLDDGERFKTLRGHLATLGMTPEQYRAKWSLPSDYPMVAPNYAAQRSALAKSLGLGHCARGPSVQRRRAGGCRCAVGELRQERGCRCPTGERRPNRRGRARSRRRRREQDQDPRPRARRKSRFRPRPRRNVSPVARARRRHSRPQSNAGAMDQSRVMPARRRRARGSITRPYAIDDGGVSENG